MGAGAGAFPLSGFCRKEEPTIFELRVGLVRVCLEEVRRFEVPKVVVMVEDMIRLESGMPAIVEGRGRGGGGVGREIVLELHRSTS